ncbi:sensor histidine kinase [Alteribacter natronophilus]|uniref:sensor histidine kinase n=1 Tax=Alteribacter natronophilus TaxID=2583810 RepID=UPI00110DADF2|nr:GAF domain-containing sensor histidine kinase [Alteribacter natronophilus]TMW70134.1 GAF domain-containing sensor histidine kinase [Alteribacter natronophilus]
MEQNDRTQRLSDTPQAENREKLARIYMTAVTVLGALFVAAGFFQLEVPWSFSILLLLALFLLITESSAIPVWKGAITLGFPLIFSIDLLFGLPVALITYAVVVAFIHQMRRRTPSIVAFNPAQLVISLAAGKWAALTLTGSWVTLPDSLGGILAYATIYTVVFYLVNHLLVDVLLWLRPQPFPLHQFGQKLVLESAGMLFSIFYLGLFFLLGDQNRGDVVDIFSFFFFFSPLVGIALIGSSNFKLRREKERLEGLVTISEELNRHIPDRDWLSGMEEHLQKLFEFDALSIWIKKDGEWRNELDRGVGIVMPDEKEINRIAEETKELTAVMSVDRDPVLKSLLHSSIRSAVICPMTENGEIGGLILVARRRPQETRPDELKVVKALANQLEVVTRGRTLMIEREQRMILEERNRIAREIHDGIAQSVAGTVMQLEAARRKAEEGSDGCLETMNHVLPGLRKSLTEIRESIYALRPFPTDARGLFKAVKEETDRVKRENPALKFHFTWEEAPELAPQIEKLVYNTFKESVQNAIKHAGAEEITIAGAPESDGSFRLRIADDGRGFLLRDALMKSRNGRHFGILNMNEEAAKADAVLQIDSRPGEGTAIELHIPGDEEGRDDSA